MSNFQYKNPLSPIQVLGAQSVSRTSTFGTNFSILGTGGYMEVYGLTDLNFVIPVGQTGFIEFSGNTIPIEFNKGTGTAFSPDVVTLNSDNMSSGRRRLGMLVYVYETNKIYRHTIENYGGLWSAATDASGVGGPTVVISDFGTTVKNNSVAGQNLINAWTGSTIEGVDGYTNLNATWRELVTGSGGTSTADTFVTGFTLSSNTITLTQNRTDQYSSFTISLSAYTGSSSTTGAYLPLSGGTVTGDTIFQSGLTANTLNVTGNTLLSGLTATTISATTYQNVNAVTGGSYSNGTITLSGTGTFASSISGFPTTFINDYLPLSGGTVTGNTIFNSGLTANTLNVTGDTLLSGLTAATISATTYYNYPDTFVTGFTLSSNTITLTQNRTDGYSSFTISLSAYTGSSSTSGAFLPLSGGTVTGGTIFQSGVTANTISEVNYVNFKTSPSIPNPTGGTLYYDSNENALSYKPITQSNDVTVNLGQESLIRIYNNLGYQINNGQVLHITGGTNGVPTVALANASKLGTVFTEGLAQSSGVATHNIPNEEYGFMTNFGVVRDLNTTAFTVGQEVFLSDTVDGGLTNSPDNIAYTSRISTVGYCLESNATTGKILVSITNENQLQSLTQQEVNVLLGNTISTGVYEYTGITQGTGQTVNVAYTRGWIVYNTNTYATNPLVLNVYYTGGTNIPLTYLNSADATYFLINSGATLLQQATFPTPQQRRENLFLGKVVHPNRSTILGFNNTVDFDVSPMSAIRDIWTPIKLINQGVLPSFNTGLTINTSYGTLWGNGIGWTTSQLNPDSVTIAAKTRASFFYRTQTGGTSSAVFDIDPTKYDVGGVITSVGAPGSNDATNQRIYMYPTGVINILYGQTRYTTLAEAVSNIDSESFVIYPNADTTGILIGIISVRNDIVADGEPLTNTTYAKLTLTSKFGESFGGTGGISTTTLQQAYNNSTSPEIVISAALDGLTIQNGTGNADNVTNLLEGRATSSGTTSFIRADGLISGSSVSAPTISATTISATTYENVNAVTGGTYNGTTGVITLSGTGSVNGNQITGFSTGGGGLTWNNSTTTQSASVDNGYVGTATTLTTITLPSTAAFGSIVEVVGTGTGLWRISQNVNQFINFGVATTTTGTGGYLSATSQYDCVKLLCTSADTAFVVTSAIGNIFYI